MSQKIKAMDYKKPKNIFIVDDDPMLAEACKDFLTRKVPHSIRTFSTGEQCLKNITKQTDIIILDYYLNSQEKDAANGMEILKSIKLVYPLMHIIMLSNQERYAVAMQTLQKGAEHYVIKDKDAFVKIAELIDGFN
jgi:two-component system, OmpR family, response regulator